MHLFEDVAARRALKESAARTRGHRGEVLSVVVARAGLTGALSAVGLGAVNALGRFLVPRV